jgi:hypothetical protein
VPYSAVNVLVTDEDLSFVDGQPVCILQRRTFEIIPVRDFVLMTCRHVTQDLMQKTCPSTLRPMDVPERTNHWAHGASGIVFQNKVSGQQCPTAGIIMVALVFHHIGNILDAVITRPCEEFS